MSAASQSQDVNRSAPEDVNRSAPEGAKTIHDSRDEERYHLLLGVSSEAHQVLEDLSHHYRVNKADVINMAVGLLKYLADAAKEGKRFGVVSGDQELETEITGL